MQRSLEDYRVELDCYAGPLDLLLYLVRRHEIDLHDVPIAKLTEQYLAHLRLLEQLAGPGAGGGLDVNLAGEFLVMAATLLEIKSQMLLPRPAGDSAEGQAAAPDSMTNPLDPRYELVQQLLAYKRFKDAAHDLEDRRQQWESRFARVPARSAGSRPTLAELEAMSDLGGESPPDQAAPIEIDLEDVHVLDLCEAFARLLESIGEDGGGHRVVYDDTPIALHAEDILDRLQRDGQGGSMTLQEIFVGRASRSEMVGLFLATLELVRQKRLAVVQEQVGGAIRLALRPAEDADAGDDERPADWRDPRTGAVQYDWPSEEARRAADRRARLRAAHALKRARGEAVAEEEMIDVEVQANAGDEPPAV